MAKRVLDVLDWKDMKIMVTHYHMLLVYTLAISKMPMDRLCVHVNFALYDQSCMFTRVH